MPTRRTVLNAALVTAGSGVFTGAALTPLMRHGEDAAAVEPAAANVDAPAIEKFKLRMPVPRVLTPYSTSDGVDRYRITMRTTQAEILPGLRTTVETYGGYFPGPVIRARSGRPVAITQRNSLDMPTSVHLHGSSVPAIDDGGPMETIAPGGSRLYTYPNQQSHASLWFHDHAHHMESEHVYRGLYGTYLLTDAEERSLPLPCGAYDVPIAIRDAQFDAAGQFVYVMGDFQNRTTLMANGVAYPRFEVAARKYRLRLLNSSNLRSFRLRLADGGEIVQIGSDGGLLTKPNPTDAVFLSPGERVDVVVDFSRYAVGTQLVLENTLLNGGPAELLGQVMRFDVVRTATDRSEIPSALRELPPLPQPTAERTVVLSMDETGGANAKGYINGKTYDPDRVDDFIRHGASEVWTVTNTNRFVPHNIHLHLVQFRVLERNGQPPAPAEAGLKDTVMLMPGETVKLQATFDTYRGTYLYHCHLIDHAAMGMMAQFKVS
ncbi:multicopper oxidase family protein [Streptomyces olivochromogenes]|uniref:multicopper oxidase family protein n=1 Tax=Streptomyces olivochromogenes TaxID=1963 RepID=UPI001F1E9030|nr:multicopper oxidase domain-containing protein [Streptomyces olivochromogenes]MCF3136755.1 multicopper oxidase domain-containing protein [Streptomyces olivochromogenes]